MDDWSKRMLVRTVALPVHGFMPLKTPSRSHARASASVRHMPPSAMLICAVLLVPAASFPTPEHTARVADTSRGGGELGRASTW